MQLIRTDYEIISQREIKKDFKRKAKVEILLEFKKERASLGAQQEPINGVITPFMSS